ncbi:hypothetical protein VTK26DRAFT_8748 [Humicola hyalothermophila]
MTKYVGTFVDDCQFKRGLQDQQGPAAIIRNFERLPADQREGDPANPRRGDNDNKIWTTPVHIRYSLYERYAFEYERLTPYVFPPYLLETFVYQRSRGQREDRPAAAGAGHESDTGSASENANEGGDAKTHTESARPRLRIEVGARRRAVLEISPLETLQLLDEAVTEQMDGLLTLDYFELYDDSVALLKAVAAALGPEMQARAGLKEGEPPVGLGRLPILLRKEMDKDTDLGEMMVMKALVKVCRVVLRDKGGKSWADA